MNKAKPEELWIDPRFQLLSLEHRGPLVRLEDGSLLILDMDTMWRSRDNGKSWSSPNKLDLNRDRESPPHRLPLIRTSNGAIVLVWQDLLAMDWDSERIEPTDDSRIDVWTTRSLDKGKTWTDRQKIFEGICGHLGPDILQTKSGRIVVAVQFYVRDPARNVIRTYVSDDDGKSWRGSNIIDLRGQGHHDGALEPTLVELEDGRLWMLIRTSWDRFWEAYSEDQGLSWRVITPSNIDASTSPGRLARLASRRLVLLWNRLYPEGQTSFPRRPIDQHRFGAQLSDTPAIWHREELSIALSVDDGTSWSDPIVIARQRGAAISYPYLFEVEPGLLWIFTDMGNLSVRSMESDLVAGSSDL